MSAPRRIQTSKNYELFGRSAENRPLDVKKHRRLLTSMQKYGFLKCYPIVVTRDADGKLTVKDGQHRLYIAQSLGLPVYWYEEEVDFDVAEINTTPIIWKLKDYAQKHAANGLTVYQEGQDFAERYGMQIGTAFSLLAGTVSFNNIQDAFKDGTFKIKDRKWADAVAGLYSPLAAMSSAVKNVRFIEACMAVCRVSEFDAGRLLSNAERCREKLVGYSHKDEYLQMLESIYNYGRQKLFGLKIAAITAMRQRDATQKRKQQQASRNGHAAEAAAAK